ncbi:MAG: hypothetical protein L0332_15505 [Chloroflexi bacterium]|nr:hypothetical protein [Chloroflexota bacterium]MCI0648935.1 hypothetical protein [Chloroflexota bacterium]MCI0728109.1 hypothetical protein [Chloroflexota bacterium]
MNLAQAPDGRPLPADASAPPQARCPHCGGPVTLRHRRCMGGQVVYFWRHRGNRNRDCSARTGPVSIR